MVHDLIYPVLRCVRGVEIYRLEWGGDVGEVQSCIRELKFIRICLWWFSRYVKGDNGEENWGNLKSMLDTIGSGWENLETLLASSNQKAQSEGGFDYERYLWKGNKKEFQYEYPARATAIEEAESRRYKMDFVEEKQDQHVPWAKIAKAIKNWNLWSRHIEGAIEECKLHISRHSVHLLHCTFGFKPALSANQMLKFLDDVLQHLKPLVKTVTLKNQIETFEKKLILLQAWVELIPNCILESRDLAIGLIYDDINNDFNKLVWISFFFWAKPGDDDIAFELNLWLSDMSRKITKPSISDFSSWYFGVLKAIRPDDALLLGQAVPGFLDFLFNYLEGPIRDDYHIFRDGMIMYFTFLANPPKEHAEDEELFLIVDQLGDLICQGSPLIPPLDDTKNASSCEKEVTEFLTITERFKGKIRRMHNLIPDSSSCNFPRTNGIGFINFLLQKLKGIVKGDNMFIPFSKHVIIKIEQELASLRPDLDDIFELQKEHKELQDSWLQLINLAYLTEHTVNSCSVILYPIWYNMLCLADILDEIKVVKGKFDTVKHFNSYNEAVLPKSVGINGDIPTIAWYSGANEVMVGCEEEIDMIVDQLTRGPKSLEIVSIVGMGGSAKTKLARKVYDAQQVRSHFHIFASCVVSQVYSTRKLLLEILEDIKVTVHHIDSKADDDLAHLLHQQLSGKSYLVLMDDIWKIDAWEKVKSSFPNENVGSRVIFTTREREVAVKAQSKFSPHSKNLLSNEESWELLQKMAFLQADCPPHLFHVAQEIARKCSGLPLAIVVIGRLLARKERSLTLWKEIAEKTSSLASEEGCVKVLELSYMHLPEHLKSCFLYLGVFEEDAYIRAKRLILLWIAEGFVQKSERDSLEIVAEEYLNELVDRSLVQVPERSSDNRIKTCQLHDVIGDFCQRKAQEENFFQLIKATTSCNSSTFNRYRLSIHMDMESSVDLELRHPGIKSLLYNKKYSYGCRSALPKFQLVEVFDFENVLLLGEVDRVLESITSIVHLRYLAISIKNATNIDILSRITNLMNLDTFILSHSYTRFRLSENFWTMQNLRHLDVDHCYLIPCPTKFQAYPPLYNLEWFSTLVLKPEISMRILQRLPNLRKLSCRVDPFSGNESILALDVLSKLESLKLDLRYLDDVILPVTLKKLSLTGSTLPSKLGELPCLEVLKLNGYCVRRWNVEDGEFPMLKFLKLKVLCLEQWNASDGSFPRLEQIFFHNCILLHDMPASFRESTTLKKIKVLGCKSSLANVAREIQDEQNDLGNEIELLLS